MNTPSWVYIRQRPKTTHIFNNASIPDNNLQQIDAFMALKLEGGELGPSSGNHMGRLAMVVQNRRFDC